MFDGFKNPVLTIVGEKDGLMRVTRGIESYWHQYENITPEQKGQFPLAYVEGLNHAGFMDSTMKPGEVVKQDLKQEIDEAVGHNQVAQAMTIFID